MSKRHVRGRLSYRSGRGYHVPRWYMRCVQQEIVRFSPSLISVFELRSTLQRCADLALVMKVVHIKDHTTHAIRVAVGKLFQVLLMFQALSSSSCTEFTQCFGGNTSIRTIDVRNDSFISIFPSDCNHFRSLWFSGSDWLFSLHVEQRYEKLRLGVMQNSNVWHAWSSRNRKSS